LRECESSRFRSLRSLSRPLADTGSGGSRACIGGAWPGGDRLPLSARFWPDVMPDEASNESMPGIVVLRGVVLAVPLDKGCGRPGDGVSVALLTGCSCSAGPAEGCPPIDPPLGGVERCGGGGPM
jgi:hypothetical protein